MSQYVGKWVYALLLALPFAVLDLPWSVQAQAPTPPSSVPTASEDESLSLRTRAAAYWAARIAGDADAQWQLLEPRGKGRTTAEQYGAVPTGGRYLAYQVEGATINGFFATVKVRLMVQQVLPASGRNRVLPPQPVVLEDGWVRIGGVWYRRLDADAKPQGEPRQP